MNTGSLTSWKNVLTQAHDEHDDNAQVWHRVKRIMLSARLVWPLTLLVGGLLVSLSLAVAIIFFQFEVNVLKRLLLLSTLLSVAGLVIAGLRLRNQLLKPIYQKVRFQLRPLGFESDRTGAGYANRLVHVARL